MTQEILTETQSSFIGILEELITGKYNQAIQNRATLTRENITSGKVKLLPTRLVSDIRVAGRENHTATVFIPESPSLNRLSSPTNAVIAALFDINAALQGLAGSQYTEEIRLKEQVLQEFTQK